jgi:cell division protein FtsB
MAFLYSQPLRSYLSTRDALAQRSQEVRALRAEKQRLERRLAATDTPAALTREARRIGYVKPGEHLFIIKGIDAWRHAHEPAAP